MRIFGFTISRTKALPALSSVSGSRSWWPLIREMSAGAWQRNEEVRVDSVLSNPTLYACVTLIAGDIAKLRLKLVALDDDGIWNETTSPAFSPVLRRPNHYQSRIDFVEWWLIAKLLHGNAYVLKARDGRGVVQALHVLDPNRVMPLVAPDGSVFYQLHQDELSGTGQAVVVPAREVIHDRICPLFHSLVGVSPIYAAGYSALQGLTIRDRSSKFFANGSKPGGVLTAPGPISKDTADRMKEYWEREFSGDNTGKIAVLGDNLKYEAMAISAEQSQLVEQLKLTDEDVAKCFHMPRHKVGIGPDPATYTNIAALNQQYYADCLQKHIEKLEAALDKGLELQAVEGRTLGVEFDRDDLFQMDNDTRMGIAERGVKAAIFSPNEARKLFDMRPAKGGESPMLQQQMFSLEALAERDDKDPFVQPTAPPPAVPPGGAAADGVGPGKSAERGIDGFAFQTRLAALVAKQARENAERPLMLDGAGSQDILSKEGARDVA
jgi:HK97 family phage portal protein